MPSLNLRRVSAWLWVAAWAVGLSAATSPSDAAIFNLGSGTFSVATCAPNCAGSFSPAAPEIGPINDYYTFQITGGTDLTNADSVTNSFTMTGAQIMNFTLLVFANKGTSLAPVADGPALATATANYVSGQMAGTQFAGTPPVVLSSLVDLGNYFIEVMGSDTSQTSYGGSYSFAAAVPESATWTMMLLGFAGLGFAAFRRSRKSMGAFAAS